MGEKNGFLPYPQGFATAVCHLPQTLEQWSSAAMVSPISAVSHAMLNKLLVDRMKEKCIGSSVGNSSRDILGKVLAHLENGLYGICLSSGSSAIRICLYLLDAGDHVICTNDIYGGTRVQLAEMERKYSIKASFVDTEPECFEKAIQPNTKMIWIESPTNPSLHVVDIEAISKIAKKHKLIFVVDNTFLSPYLQRPLNFGADICIHSASKYLNGHADVIMGAIITNEKELYEQIKSFQTMLDDMPSPFNCYQVLKSLRTLPLRMTRHCESSMLIAEYLENHSKIQKVIHPGLPSHPNYDLTKKQTSGHSGVLTIYLKGNFQTSDKFIQGLKLIMCAASLGDVASVVELPSRVSHASVSTEDKKKLNYTDNMIRISVGLEDPEDLIHDLENALAEI